MSASVAEKKQHCRGCHQDRYNHKGMCERPGIDAPVVSEDCWLLKNAKLLYVRKLKVKVMSCHSDTYHQWLVEFAKTGKKPTWRYW